MGKVGEGITINGDLPYGYMKWTAVRVRVWQTSQARTSPVSSCLTGVEMLSDSKDPDTLTGA